MAVMVVPDAIPFPVICWPTARPATLATLIAEAPEAATALIVVKAPAFDPEMRVL
jgi:hypothetical protein